MRLSGDIEVLSLSEAQNLELGTVTNGELRRLFLSSTQHDMSESTEEKLLY